MAASEEELDEQDDVDGFPQFVGKEVASLVHEDGIGVIDEDSNEVVEKGKVRCSFLLSATIVNLSLAKQ